MKGAVFHQPSMLVTQDAAGEWNVAEAVDLITRAAGKIRYRDRRRKSRSRCPRLLSMFGELKLIDRDGRTATIQPLYVSGNPNGPLVWKYDAHVEDRLRLSGEISPGGVWEHEVAFEVVNVGPWLSPWARTAPALRQRHVARTCRWAERGRANHLRSTRRRLAQRRGVAMVQRQGNGEVSVSPGASGCKYDKCTGTQILDEFRRARPGWHIRHRQDLVIIVNGGKAKAQRRIFLGRSNPPRSTRSCRDIVLRPGVSNSGSAIAKLSMPLPSTAHGSTSRIVGKSSRQQLGDATLCHRRRTLLARHRLDRQRRPRCLERESQRCHLRP